MFFTAATIAALVSFAAIPVARGADHPVIVGGTGIIAYNPPFVVRAQIVSFTPCPHRMPLDCRPGGYSHLHLHAEESHCHAVHLCEPLRSGTGRVRYQLVSV